MNIILCGLPASGKTAVGQRLASFLKRPFIDTDRLIEEATSLCCRTLYMHGRLRSEEKKAVISLQAVSESVIATGGGILCEEENLERLRTIGCLVYLRADMKSLWERIVVRGMPAYADSEQSFYALATARLPLYEAAADVTVDTTGLSEEEVYKRVWEVIHLESYSGSLRGVSPTEKR